MDDNVKKLGKGIVIVFFANAINLCINILTTFLLPKYLSVDSYAAIKTYNLYIAYVGVFSLGYVDGMFLKYGGINLEKINEKDFEINLSTFRIFQFLVTVILLIIGIILKDIIFLAFVMTMFSTNMTGYFKSFYQSIGEFKKYSRITNFTTILTFITNIVLLLVVKTDNYVIYLTFYVIIQAIIWIISEIFLRNSIKRKISNFVFSFREIVKNVKDGFLLMLGNFSNIILTSMDRWFIKALMDTFAFAQYSFACSMENFINVAATPLTVTLYNYFCKVKDKEKIRQIRNLIILMGSFIISCAFIGKFILETYLKKYRDASDVMFYLFAAQFLYLVIKSIYVNLYKSEHRQKRYFLKLIIIIIAGFLFNVICYTIQNSKEAFAIGTLLSAILWLCLSAKDFKWLEYSWNELIYISVTVILFVLCGNNFESIIGFILYLLGITILALIFMKNESKWIIKKINKIRKKFLGIQLIKKDI